MRNAILVASEEATPGSVIAKADRISPLNNGVSHFAFCSALAKCASSSILPVPLNSSKITSSILLPVSTSAVAIIVKDPPNSIFRAAPKNCFGFCIAFASTPPLNTFPLEGATVLCALAKRVILSRRITTSWPHSTKRFAFCNAMVETFTCLSAGSSKVAAITSAFTLRSDR